MSNPKPDSDNPAERQWSANTIVAVTVAIIVAIAAVSYVINDPSTQTTSDPSATGRTSSTIGQGNEESAAPPTTIGTF